MLQRVLSRRTLQVGHAVHSSVNVNMLKSRPTLNLRLKYYMSKRTRKTKTLGGRIFLGLNLVGRRGLFELCAHF